MNLKTISLIALTFVLAACGAEDETDSTISSAHDVKNPTDSEQIYKFYADSAESAMSGPGNYGAFNYGVDDSHNMWPNFTTYLFKDGEGDNTRYFKAQIISNYGEDGSLSSGNLFVRYAEVDDVNTGTTSYASLDATAGPEYLALDSGTVVTADQAWQFAYQKYVGFSVNGGISGDGDVSACVAHTPAGIYDTDGKTVQSEFEALTSVNTLADFEAVTSESCEKDFEADALETQIALEDWLAADYSQGAPIYSASTETTNGWIVRSAADTDGNTNYSRVTVNEVFYEAGVKRAITLSVENWDLNSETFLAASLSDEINFTTDRQFWDMETNTIVTESDDWELSIKVDGHNWLLQVNSGISGAGDAGIGYVLTTDD